MPDGGSGDVPTAGTEPPAPRDPSPTGATGAAASAPTPGASGVPQKTTKEIAREALEAAGLTTPPRSTGGPRRLLLFSVVILVVLVVLVAASLVALGHLKTRLTTTTTLPTTILSTTTTTPGTSTTGPGGHTNASPLAAYAAASADGVVLHAVGSGGQPILLARTDAQTYVTDPTAAPVVIYWWNGTCAPCAAENLVVVSALESLGGTFTGLATTTETGGFTTIDLRHARYRGPVVLEASEVDGPTGRPDQPYSSQASAQYRAFDGPPYAKIAGGYPFLDVGGHFVQIGPGFASAQLAGLSLRTIAGDLSSPDLPLTRSIDGNADVLDAAICVTLAQLSRPRPTICANPSVAAIEPGLPTTPPQPVAPR